MRHRALRALAGVALAALAVLACPGSGASPPATAPSPSFEPRSPGARAALERIRPSLERLALPAPQAPTGALRFPADEEGAIEASIFFLASDLFSVEEVRSFLAALRRHAPERALILATDPALAAGLGTSAKDLRLTLVTTRGSGYSPWPRDPFTVARSGSGWWFLARPSLQAGRELDLLMAAELARTDLPALTAARGPASWSIADLAFHNGQLLQTRERLWLSIHSLEVATLERLGVSAVPVPSFSQPEGIGRYFGAALESATELGRWLGRSPTFVHPWPSGQPSDVSLVQALGGGAGFDLDSLLALLPSRTGAPAARVGDLRLGRALLAADPVRAEAELAASWGLAQATGLARALAADQEAPRARGLQGFLDHVADHLRSQGLEVQRVPLLLLPTARLAQPEAVPGSHFLLTPTNVVYETREEGWQAEGFATGWAALDGAAQASFRQAGVELTLLPALRPSVLRNGGYRCASSHLRGSRAAPP